MEKIKLEKKYFEAMELLDKSINFNSLIKMQVNCEFFNPIMKSLNELDTVTFVNALQYEYELEETPQEKIENVYKRMIKRMNSDVLDDNTWYELNGRTTMIRHMNELFNLGLNLSESDK